MLTRLAALARLDFSPPHRPPSAWRVLIAAVAAIAGSLAADAILVFAGERLFPGTRGYVHFRFSDYAKLTVIGVIIASAGWPVVARVTAAPRWVYLRLAVLVTLVLWLPDLYILYRGQPTDAVAVLMVMHVAIALVTYNILVRGAPIRGARPYAADGDPISADPGRADPGRADPGRAAPGGAAPRRPAR